MRQREKRQRVWVTAYDVSKCYGGPEEGGWWWNRKVPLESRLVSAQRVVQTRAQLYKRHSTDLPRDRYGRVRDYSSVLGGEAVWTYTEETPGENATKYRPRYE